METPGIGHAESELAQVGIIPKDYKILTQNSNCNIEYLQRIL